MVTEMLPISRGAGGWYFWTDCCLLRNPVHEEGSFTRLLLSLNLSMVRQRILTWSRHHYSVQFYCNMGSFAICHTEQVSAQVSLHIILSRRVHTKQAGRIPLWTWCPVHGKDLLEDSPWALHMASLLSLFDKHESRGTESRQHFRRKPLYLRSSAGHTFDPDT